jgi:hypothetical protein
MRTKVTKNKIRYFKKKRKKKKKEKKRKLEKRQSGTKIWTK